MLRTVDAILNRYTMYRVVLYGLGTLLVIAEVLAFTGSIAVAPVDLAASVVMLIIACYVSNRIFALLYKAPYNSESWLITALILACIVPPGHSGHILLRIGLSGGVAMASKYVLTSRGTHYLNPAAVAAFVMSVTGLLPATWWVATPPLIPISVLLALAVLRKQRKVGLFVVFTLTALALMLYIGILHGQPVWSVIHNAFTSWPIIFMGSIMLTEPSTLPPTPYYQMLYALLVGAVFASQLKVGPVSATPQAALLVGNIFTFVMTPALGMALRLKEISQLGPNLYDLAFVRPRNVRFSAGQYLEWTLPHTHTDARGNRRTFSIASSPTESEIHVGIKTYQPSSSFKKAFLQLQPGMYVRASHIAGSFTLPEQDVPLVFIAGGIGITPFRSMLQYLMDTGQQRDINLLYIASSESEFVYRDTLQAAQAIGLTTNYVLKRLDTEALRGNLPVLQQSLVYISGPDAFVSYYKQQLIDLGLRRSQIKTDHFSGY